MDFIKLSLKNFNNQHFYTYDGIFGINNFVMSKDYIETDNDIYINLDYIYRDSLEKAQSFRNEKRFVKYLSTIMFNKICSIKGISNSNKKICLSLSPLETMNIDLALRQYIIKRKNEIDIVDNYF